MLILMSRRGVFTGFAELALVTLLTVRWLLNSDQLTKLFDDTTEIV